LEKVKPAFKNNYEVLLLLSVAAFSLMLLFLSFYNRLVIDDWDYLGSLNDPGIIRYVKHLYQSWSGRWTAYPLTGFVVFLFSKNAWFLAAFILLTFLSLYLLILSLLKKLFITFRITVSLTKVHLHAALLLMTLFFTSYSKGETWFWLVHVCVYLWSIVLTLLLIRIFLSEKLKFHHLPVLAISAMYIGGASESFAVVVLFVLASYLIFSVWRKNPVILLPVNNSLIAKQLMTIVFLLGSFLFTMTAPGNDTRISALPHVEWYQTLWIFVKSCIKIFFIRLPQHLPLLVLFSLPWLYLGAEGQEGRQRMMLKEYLFSIRKIILIVIFFIPVCLAPAAVMMSELGPDRALSQITFLIAVSFAALFFGCGRKVRLHPVLNNLKIPNAALIFLFVVITTWLQFDIASKYAAAYDARWDYLVRLNASGYNGIIDLKPLPPSGFLSAGEITTDTNHFSNNFLEHALHLQCPVRLKGEWQESK